MIRIGIIGAESCGKSTLAQQLATYYGATAVDEYARYYVENLTSDYTYNDVVAIAQQQIRQLTAPYPSAMVFFDTELIITQVWFEHRYGTCPDFVTNHLRTHPLDYYLLLMPDLPFVDDPVRENPNIRKQLTMRYEQLLKQYRLSYAIVSGQGNERTLNAIRALHNAGLGFCKTTK